MIKTGGHILADQLAALGADRIFCVPGESFLNLLDGLYEHRNEIQVVACRHESGAAIMADAHARITGAPGICAVTRGPGATNASNGIHVAYQDSTPLILLVGQVGRAMLDREAFQEIDYRRMFGQMAKWVAEISDPARIPEYIARAWHVCQSGRPGPVVLALPEDMLRQAADVPLAQPSPLPAPAPAPAPEDIDRLGALLAEAERPMLLVGGPRWSSGAARAAEAFAEAHSIPLTTGFRFQDHVNNDHRQYAGSVGIGPNPLLAQRIREDCDLMIAIGERMGEITSQGYELLDLPNPQMPLVHVHPAPEETGLVYRPSLAISATAETFFAAAARLPALGPDRRAWCAAARADFDAYQVPPATAARLDLAAVVRHMDDMLPADTVYANGAGNYSVWLHRFIRHRSFRGQLAPTNGSMGYGVPAAIAAKIAQPERTVIAWAGDGCFLMTSQELATAVAAHACPIFIVVNNRTYGTIRMHQERHHPGRVIATDLTNPDFVAYAGAFGIPGECVTETAGFAPALARARASVSGYLIELQTEAEEITPSTTLSQIRAEANAHG